MIRQRFLQATSVIIILAALFATLSLGGLLVRRERAELQRRTQAQAQLIATQLHIGMKNAFEPLTRLGSWWLSQGKPDDPEDWQSDAQLFLASATGLRQALWVGRDGVQRWSAVPGSIPSTKPIRTDNAIRRLVEDARTRDSLVLSGLLSAPEISQALYVCAPVHKNN